MLNCLPGINNRNSGGREVFHVPGRNGQVVDKRSRRRPAHLLNNMKKRNPHRGSSFDDFLKEEGIYEEVTATAAMRVIVDQIRSEMRRRKITEAELARRMATSRSQVHCLLSAEKKSATVETLVRAAGAVGKRLSVELVAT